MNPRNDLGIAQSRQKLLDSFCHSPDLVFVRAYGNWGDELIYAGTRELLAGQTYREVSIMALDHVEGHTALVAGSGGWCKPFHEMPSYLEKLEERFHTVIILPSTFDASEETVRKALRKTKALVFAREPQSFREIQSLCKADIAHDCAFFFNYESYRRTGRGVLNAFRTDAESQGKPLPDGNIDISASCSSLNEWLWTIARHSIVRTDRAHVMIAAAMLGKRVEYDASIYHKLPAIAEYALKHYAVTRIGDTKQNPPKRNQDAYVEPVMRFASYLASACETSKVVVLDDLESQDALPAYSDNDILVIPNAIAWMSRNPKNIGLLKEHVQNARMTLLADHIDLFTDSKSSEGFLIQQGFHVEHFGHVNVMNRKAGTLAVVTANNTVPAQTPKDFKVVALLSSYNEGDILIPSIQQLIQNGIDVYLIDNWSTDDTYQKAQTLLGKGLIGLERFPADGPSPTYDWLDLLKRKEELSKELNADWFIHQDIDECRESPWEGVSLRDAIYRVDQQGYNTIDFTVLNFPPVDNGFQADSSFVEHFEYCQFANPRVHCIQIQAWKSTEGGVVLTESGGHCAVIAGIKVYPFKFLLRHYPIRSQAHGEQKVFADRLQRFSPIEKSKGMHTQYDQFAPGACFLKNPEALIKFDSRFYTDYLIERLSRIGIIPLECEQIEAFSSKITEQETQIATQEAQIAVQVTQITARDVSIQQMCNEIASREATIQNVSQQMCNEIANREATIQNVSEQLAKITRSRSWRMALRLQKIRTLIAPVGSQRARALRWAKSAFKRVSFQR